MKAFKLLCFSPNDDRKINKNHIYIKDLNPH